MKRPDWERTKKWLAALDPGSPRWLLLPLVAVSAYMLTLQVETLFVPIVGEHNWRQADTFSVAYNFVHESMNFFHPRIDWNQGRSGIMGMETPILSYLIALAMHVFGDSAVVGRVVVWLLAMTGLVCGGLLLRRGPGAGAASGLLLMFALSPMALFELRQIQPDGVIGMLGLVAALFFWTYAEGGRAWFYWVGMAVFTAAVLVKGPGVFLAPAMWLFSVCGGRIGWRRALLRGLPFAIPLGLYLLWSRWAHHLNAAYNDGEVYFAIEYSWKGMLADMTSARGLRDVFEFLLPNYMTNWALFPAVLTGMAVSFRRDLVRMSLPFWAWLLFCALFLAAFSGRLHSHWYYAGPILPAVLYFGAIGLGEVFALLGPKPAGEGPFSRNWAAFAILIALCFTRILGGPLLEGEKVMAASGPLKDHSWVGELGMRLLILSMLVAVGLSAMRGLGRTLLAVVLIVAASVVMVPRAMHDATEVLHWRTRKADWPAFAQSLETARAAADRHSDRSTLFVADVGNPWGLYLPLRKGWADETRDIDRKGLATYQKRGARFLFHLKSAPLPRQLKDVAPLQDDPLWALYALDAPASP